MWSVSDPGAVDVTPQDANELNRRAGRQILVDGMQNGVAFVDGFGGSRDGASRGIDVCRVHKSPSRFDNASVFVEVVLKHQQNI